MKIQQSFSSSRYQFYEKEYMWSCRGIEIFWSMNVELTDVV